MSNNLKFEILNLKFIRKEISNSNGGQSLLEVVVVIAVGLIVISALVFATISGLRNAQFAKNQSIATKLAQEGIEKVKGIRDRNEDISFSGLNPADPDESIFKFNKLWCYSMSITKCTSACSFYFDNSTNPILTRGTASEKDQTGQFERQILISDGNNYNQEKTITAVVKWSDFSGEHKSELTTLLRRIEPEVCP